MMYDQSIYNSLTPRYALQLAAPHTWAASVCPALFGDFYCWQQGIALPVWKGILLLIACVLLQSSVNTLNDYFDFVKGTDSTEDNVEVHDATLVYGNINPKSALRLGTAYLLAGAVIGIWCCIGSGWMPVIFGLIGALVIVLYSGGPLPLSYLPLGECISGFVMGGMIPLGIALCADGQIHLDLLFYSLPLMLGIGLIMMSNNGCDIEKDKMAGRKTLPVCLGRNHTLILYRLTLSIWFLLVVLMPFFLLGRLGWINFGFLLILAGKTIIRQMTLTLDPKERIQQMKGINLCNIRINGVYIISLVYGLILEAIHG